MECWGGTSGEVRAREYEKKSPTMERLCGGGQSLTLVVALSEGLEDAAAQGTGEGSQRTR